MTPPEVLLVAAGAAAGAPLRFLAGHYLDRADRPWGTLLVNLVGSLLLGAFTGLALGGSALALLGTGFCGALTTFSTLAVQTHRLGAAPGAVYGVVSLGGALAACALGFLLTA